MHFLHVLNALMGCRVLLLSLGQLWACTGNSKSMWSDCWVGESHWKAIPSPWVASWGAAEENNNYWVGEGRKAIPSPWVANWRAAEEDNDCPRVRQSTVPSASFAV
jgi:hypothetical protein